MSAQQKANSSILKKGKTNMKDLSIASHLFPEKH